ncbi:hypothetical protein NUU61_000905 [Penicillium alfredii]|uniref:Fatty acid hydroxylase domain-containing protein n=1 Tax=Penicillium alfredii TaxID=1506179 RepID=A0A9W9GAL8_9EURO|nr:uncharacterized protein NUU61_000905 [Penicillium alfredii]KAJ5115146.1 hypothetical protein NUU61_000905 [Penicillium alfredii]
MDVFLDILDTFVFDRCYALILPNGKGPSIPTPGPDFLNQNVRAYFPLEPSKWAEASEWKRDHIARQAVSLFLITWIFGLLTYLVGGLILYHTIFDKKLLQHPRFLPNQIQQEIKQGLTAMPVMALLTAPFFLAEVRGWSKLYDFTSEAPFRAYTCLQFPLFVFFTDSAIYWIHRGLHHPRIYRWLHKPHHKWVVPTPFASYAFHPFDGWSQSLPYHVFPLVFPLQKAAYLGLFIFVSMWTVLIHDAAYLSESRVVNGSACHTMHHLYFNYNYGQFTTFWDRLGGTYRKPKADSFMCIHQQTKHIGDKQD